MKLNMFRSLVVVLLATSLLVSCSSGNDQEGLSEKEQVGVVHTPVFQGDTAFEFIRKQVEFGPRVPNSKAHQLCGDYLVNRLRNYGWQVSEQKFQVNNYKGEKLNARNIIGAYRPELKKRVLLTSHWDSRPWADEDQDNSNTPVPAANDGASGVGVLLEIARVLHTVPDSLHLGVDIIFFDVEDSGNSNESNDEFGGYCLGSLHWSQNKHIDGYSAYFGILLDMVGAKNATFPKEGISRQYAGEVVKKIWSTASKLGYDRYFINVDGPGITDDHLPVNKYAKIPMVDVVHLQVNNQNHTFFEHWHTADDTLENIDPETLKAVGQTVLQVLYEEALPVM